MESEVALPDPERLAVLRLTLVDGLGPVRLRALLAAFGSGASILQASAQELQQVDGIGGKLAAAILAGHANPLAERLWQRMARLGVSFILDTDPVYPPLLMEIPQSPVALSVRGELLDADRTAVAVVGSRQCSNYGRKMAAEIAGGLASRGVTVVSGLARGIDGVAHRAALDAGGRTLAVMASGLANIYPPEHADLAEEIVRQGALLSEAPLDGKPLAGLFLPRNRIVSGLSLGVVVVEASTRSGALSTAYHALDQNREVFAVPGRVDEPSAEGVLGLIRKGACLVRNADDVIEQLGSLIQAARPAAPPKHSKKAIPEPNLEGTEQALWLALGTEPVELEMLLELTGLATGDASNALLMMEMRRLVQRLPGNCYIRRSG